MQLEAKIVVTGSVLMTDREAEMLEYLCSFDAAVIGVVDRVDLH